MTKQEMIEILKKSATYNLEAQGYDKEKIEKLVSEYGEQLETKDEQVLKNLIMINC